MIASGGSCHSTKFWRWQSPLACRVTSHKEWNKQESSSQSIHQNTVNVKKSSAAASPSKWKQPLNPPFHFPWFKIPSKDLMIKIISQISTQQKNCNEFSGQDHSFASCLDAFCRALHCLCNVVAPFPVPPYASWISMSWLRRVKTR